MEDKNELVILKDFTSTYRNPNELVMASQKQTKYMAKLRILLLADIRNAWFDEKDHVYKQRLSADAIVEAFGLKSKGGSFYKNLNKATSDLMGSVLGVEDKENHYFKYITIIDSAEYKDQILEVCYNPIIFKEYYKSITKNFSTYQTRIMLGFSSIYSLRLYEILKSRAYPDKTDPHTSNNVYQFSFNVSQLQLLLGVVDSGEKKVRQVLSNSTRPDYDTAVDKAPESYGKQWKEFSRSILKKAIDEINATTDLHVEVGHSYGVVNGRRKVSEVRFKVRYVNVEERDGASADKADLTQEDQDKALDFLCDATGLKISEARKVCETANYDIDRLKVAVSVMDHNGKPVRDKIAFLISAINKGFTVADRHENAQRNTNNFHFSGERGAEYAEEMARRIEEKMVDDYLSSKLEREKEEQACG